jgi:hypothetical protein
MNQEPWEVSCAVATNAGMCALWQPEHFAHVTDLDTWEDEVAEDAALIRHMERGAFVPLNVGGDGAFQITVRGGSSGAGLGDREERYVLVSSQPYLLDSRGSIALGGLESVGGAVRHDALDIPVEAGRYSVTVHLIDWKAEPGSLAADGSPSASALPDFLAVFRAGSETLEYRTKVSTFDRA